MSYQVLARKWRPQVFEDVVGQGHITRTLQNAIATNRLAHAFLFSGPRGVVKTTTARILAKALNCKNGPTPNPCGKCDSCLETAAGMSVDVIEIDGASNRGIEHIRELRETVKYAPVGGKYKIYVIDEVHMLTNEAFNALLKTLEEPPPNVLFIFATTEPQKVPPTIHSRCQRYGFKRIGLQEIAAKLRDIANKEGITVSDQGLALIARAAEGSMRDSQSLLDQAVSYCGLQIDDASLQSILGAVAQDALLRFTDELLRSDAAGLMVQVDELLERGQDMRQFLGGVAEHLRNLIVSKIAKEPSQIVELPSADLARIAEQASAVDLDRLVLLFDSLSRTLDSLRWSPHQRFTLEIGLIKACSLVPLAPLGEVLDRVKTMEARLSGGDALLPSGQALSDRAAPHAQQSRARPASPPAPAGGGSVSDRWERVVAVVKRKKPGLAMMLASSRVIEQSEARMQIGIQGTQFQLEQAEEKANRQIVEQAAAEVFGQTLTVSFQLQGTGSAAPPKPAPPAKKAEPREQDPLVQDALSIFNGEMIDPDPNRK